MERGQPDTISRAQLNEIEDYNLARRIVSEWDDIPPAMDEVKNDRRRLNEVPIYRDPDQQADYLPIPWQLEVVPEDGTGPEQLSGGYSRQLRCFHCEYCVFIPSRHPMLAMILVDTKAFATTRATEREAMMVAMRSLQETTWDQFIEDMGIHSTEGE